MFKSLTAVGASIFMAAGISACGGAALTAHSVATNPQAKKELAKAQVKIQKCATKSNFVTKSGRHQFIACIAPPGKKVQTTACIQKAAAGDHLWKKSGRQQFMVDAAECVVN